MDKKKLITSLVFIIIVGAVIISLTVSKKSYAVGTTLVDTVKALNKGSSYGVGANGVYYTNSHEYRYIGVKVNNYVKFNNDMYRIIGVFDGNSHGVSGTELVKLIRARSLDGYSWGVHNTDSSTGTYFGYANDWTGKSKPSPANLNVLLNEYFYNKTDTSSIYGDCANWTYYDNNNNSYRSMDCSRILAYGIDNSLRNYIETVTWYLYGGDYNQSKQNFYLCERGGNSCTPSGQNQGAASVTSKIGLMYVSDYMYASGNFSVSDSITSTMQFGINNWLNKAGFEWTITPSSLDDEGVMSIYQGSIASNSCIIPFDFRPTFYLKSSVYVTGGNGSFDNPYTIACDNCTE